MKELCERIGYEFNDRLLLKEALTHTSYANEHRLDYSNERLEFLGDSVLSVIVSDYLFLGNPGKPEGELTKTRASLVCEATLSIFARELGLGRYMYLGKGELHTGGSDRASILADCFEAIVAAIYLDGGMQRAREFVLGFVEKYISSVAEELRDYKTELQEVIQQNPEERLRYVVCDESGPDHNKLFTVEVWLNSNVFASGQGHSKKLAEQAAAAEALKLMGL